MLALASLWRVGGASWSQRIGTGVVQEDLDVVTSPGHGTRAEKGAVTIGFDGVRSRIVSHCEGVGFDYTIPRIVRKNFSVTLLILKALAWIMRHQF